MDVLERIKSVIKWLIGQGLGSNQEEIGKLLGYTNKSSFSQLLNGKKPLPSNFINKLASLHKDVNESWVLSGDGRMTQTKFTSDAKEVEITDFMKIPFIPIHAQAGYASGYGDQEYIDNLPTIPVIVDRNYKGKYRIFEVAGDSMDDGSRNALYDGDKILCREIKPEYWKSKLHIKDWYFVIVCKNDGIIVKQITEHDVDNCIIHCHSLNSLFEDFEMNLDDVAELYNVIKIVDRNTRI